MKSLKKQDESTPTLTRSNQILNAGLKAFADHISSELAPTDLIAAFGAIKDVEEVVTDLNKNLRNRVLAALKSDGSVTTDKGTMRLEVNGVSIEARPQRTGYDPKKVEGLLRAKNEFPEVHMDKVITYSINLEKLMFAKSNSVFSDDELESCKYDINYALQRPKVNNE